MVKSGTIALSDIEWIKIYFNTKRRGNSKSGLKTMLNECGGDYLLNAAIFLRNGNPCCHLKADGVVKCNPGYAAWGISWNTPLDYRVKKVANSDKNYMECVHAIIGGKKIDTMNYGSDMAYACHRTAFGVKDGRLAYYCTDSKLTPEKLRDTLYAAGWSDAIMMDGGGSACYIDKSGNYIAGDGRYIPFYIAIKLKQSENEPKGDKPMVEINAYSLKKDGSKKLTKNFQVKEFACKDGSDAIFIARELPMVLQYIRMRTGKAVIINSAYRTVTHNKSVGGAEYSQHTYGTAADIKVSGYTPAKLAEIAREIMSDWGGVGIYDWGIHIDVREVKTDWKG